MLWKTNTSKGHVMGYVREPRTGATFDGTTLTLSGPTNRTLSTDATGFFGAADLPVGNYLLTLAIPGYRTLTRSFSVTGATVTEPELSLEQIPLQIISAVRGAVGNVLTITGMRSPAARIVEGSNDLQTWQPFATGSAAANAMMTYQWQIRPPWGSQAFARVAEEP